MSCIVKNRLKDLIQKKYRTLEFKPTPELLKTLNMTAGRFRNIYNNKQNPSFEELYLLCDTFEIDLRQMYVKVDAPTVELHNFKSKILNKHA